MKSPAALVIGLGKHADDEDDSDGDAVSEDGDEKKDAAQALLDAIASKDADAVADAFSTLHAICNEGKY